MVGARPPLAREDADASTTRTVRSAVSAHSKTVGAAPEIPLRPRMQVSPTGSAITEGPPLEAACSSQLSASLVAALLAKQQTDELRRFVHATA